MARFTVALTPSRRPSFLSTRPTHAAHVMPDTTRTVDTGSPGREREAVGNG
ncbi:hypothetical protein SAZ11_60165 [Streptomyces sp. FXJ1.4098]|nr:hypothetical protein [Streptomyces sp. FXJ1.4098]